MIRLTPAQRVATAAKRARVATAQRDQAIRAMRSEGATLRTIADAAGLTHAGVARILNKTQ